MTISNPNHRPRLRQRLRRWFAIPATTLALMGIAWTSDSSTHLRADEVVATPSSTSGVGPGGTGANQRSVQRDNGAYETLPTRRNRRYYGNSGRYYSSRPSSNYYRSPRYNSYYYGGPRGYYVPRGGYYGYGYGYGGYPGGFYGPGYGYYGGRGAVGIGPLTFWW